MRLLLISPPEVYATRQLLAEAAGLEVDIELRQAGKIKQWAEGIEPENYDALFIRQGYPYFTEVMALAKRFSEAGKTVVDSAIAQGDLEISKLAACQKMAGSNLPIPKTAPWTEIDPGLLRYPCVLKWIYGFGGKSVFLVKEPEQIPPIVDRYPPRQLLWQEFLPAQWEYKIITIGYKSLPVVLKFKINPKTSVSNLENFEKVPAGEIPKIVELAERGSRLLGRELAKTDILESNGRYYILEVNRWPGIKPWDSLSGINVTREFLLYIKRQVGLKKSV